MKKEFCVVLVFFDDLNNNEIKRLRRQRIPKKYRNMVVIREGDDGYFAECYIQKMEKVKFDNGAIAIRLKEPVSMKGGNFKEDDVKTLIESIISIAASKLRAKCNKNRECTGFVCSMSENEESKNEWWNFSCEECPYKSDTEESDIEFHMTNGEDRIWERIWLDYSYQE